MQDKRKKNAKQMAGGVQSKETIYQPFRRRDNEVTSTMANWKSEYSE